MTKVKPTNNKMNACHNTVTNGDFTLVQDSYNTYNLIITNTTLCNQMKGESNKEAYDRNPRLVLSIDFIAFIEYDILIVLFTIIATYIGLVGIPK